MKIATVKQLLGLFSGMAGTAAIADQRWTAWRTGETTLFDRDRAFALIGIVITWIDGRAGTFDITQAIQQM